MQTDEGKEQCQGNDACHDDRASPVAHEEEHDQRDQQNAFEHIMQNGVHTELHQVFTVIEGLDSHVFRKVFTLYLVDFGLQCSNHLLGVLALAHHHNTLNDIVFIFTTDLTQPGLARLMHLCQMADEDGRAVHVLHHNIANLLNVVDQPDASHDVCLAVTFDDVATNIHIAVGDGLKEFKTADAVLGQLVGIDTHLKRLYLAAETHDVGNAGNAAEFALNHPVLQRLQLPYIPLARGQSIAENLARRPAKRLDLRPHPVGQVRIVDHIIDLLTRILVVHMVVKDHCDDRQAEERRAADVGLLLDRVHGYLNGYRHELLYLLGRASAPLGNDCHLCIGDIRKRIYGRILEA